MVFNLLNEEWIPVLWTDGRFSRVGIRKALNEAGSIREVRESSPLVTFGIYRLLIVVLKWVGGIVQHGDWAEARGQSALPPRILAYLGQRDCASLFDLYNLDRPFFQHSAKKVVLSDSKRNVLKTAAYLATEIPTETYKAHFWHANDETTLLCSACCVCGLLTLPPFCTGVGQGNETSINNVPPAYWLVRGERLLDTLLLNMPDDATEGDAPCWADGRAINRIGPLEGMTWQARRVVIPPDGISDGRCSRCGEPAAPENLLVRRIIFANRETKKADDPRLASWVDPHIAGEFEKKKEKTRFVGLAADVAPGAWCRLVKSLLSPSVENKRGQAPNVEALASCAGGRYEAISYLLHSDKADFEHWQEERWPISPAMVNEPPLRDAILAAAKQAQVIIGSLSGEWPERVWRLRYPDRKPDKNARKAWKKSTTAAAARSAITEFDKRLANWFRAQMRIIANGGGPEVLADLPNICREAGHGAVVPIIASLSPAASLLGQARIDQAAKELIEGAVRKMERAIE